MAISSQYSTAAKAADEDCLDVTWSDMFVQSAVDELGPTGRSWAATAASSTEPNNHLDALP